MGQICRPCYSCPFVLYNAIKKQLHKVITEQSAYCGFQLKPKSSPYFTVTLLLPPVAFIRELAINRQGRGRHFLKIWVAVVLRVILGQPTNQSLAKNLPIAINRCVHNRCTTSVGFAVMWNVRVHLTKRQNESVHERIRRKKLHPLSVDRITHAYRNGRQTRLYDYNSSAIVLGIHKRWGRVPLHWSAATLSETYNIQEVNNWITPIVQNRKGPKHNLTDQPPLRPSSPPRYTVYRWKWIRLPLVFLRDVIVIRTVDADACVAGMKKNGKKRVIT